MNRIDRAPHLSAFIKYLLWVNHAGRHGDALVKERDAGEEEAKDAISS